MTSDTASKNEVEGEICLTNADPQHECPIFRLPAELRTRIYEYLFGCPGVLHVFERCYSSGMFSQSVYRPQIRTKWTYALCRCPEAWEARYAYTANVNDSSDVEASYDSNWHSHEEMCLRPTVLHKTASWLRRQEIRRCAHHSVHLTCPNCMKMQLVGGSDEILRRFDNEWKRKYDASHLDLRVLQTCRRIYAEASLLPYGDIVFASESHSCLMDASYALTPQKRLAVKNIRHLYFEDVRMMTNLLYAYPNMKRLQVLQDWDNGVLSMGGSEFAKAWRKMFCRSKLEHVQVITRNRTNGPPLSPMLLRGYSEKMERLLLSRNLEDAQRILGKQFTLGMQT